MKTSMIDRATANRLVKADAVEQDLDELIEKAPSSDIAMNLRAEKLRGLNQAQKWDSVLSMLQELQAQSHPELDLAKVESLVALS